MIRNLRLFTMLLLLFLFAGLPLRAQLQERERITCPRGVDGEIQVRVRYSDNRPVDQQLQVALTNSSGLNIASQYIQNGGFAKFHVSRDGVYYAKVTGEGIEPVTSQSIEFTYLEEACRGVQFANIIVKSTGAAASGSTHSAVTPGTAPITSAAELKVPQNARKAFDQGMTAWQKKDYKQAAEKFEKAVDDYPQYDTAYNNLGVMYAHLGQDDKSLAAFRRAVELNDKNADADRNLARMLIREKDYAQAEDLLKKSLVVDPTEASTLTMLVIAEAQNGKLDEAVKDARKVHSLPHDGYAVVHYIAGEVLEGKHQYADATTEYDLYLKEAPNGPEAAQVKSALERIASSASAAPKGQ